MTQAYIWENAINEMGHGSRRQTRTLRHHDSKVKMPRMLDTSTKLPLELFSPTKFSKQASPRQSFYRSERFEGAKAHF
jgi:hypothetical protein